MLIRLKHKLVLGLKPLLLLVFILATPLAQAENAAISQTKSKLKQLDDQINQLKQTLATAHDKRGTLHQELANTEKEIGEGIRHLRDLQTNIAAKQTKITHLQARVNELNQQLTTQQKLLTEHVRARHKLGEYQPLKLILNQDDPYAISRLLTFYQYVVHSRQTVIDQIDNTRQSLTQNQETLKQELDTHKRLEEKLHDHQQALEHNKQYHKTVIQTLNQDIQSKKHRLAEFQKNKANLSRLLKTLAAQSIPQPKRPFTQMRHKLPRPVSVPSQSVKRMNQGVTFFAGEGTTVNAVYPGKVVFSDWLNGYGLLLIIDHGQGFMTLYAHNQSLFKRKGSQVIQGEAIASVGHSGGIKQNGLYFEVRKRGKAVPPLEWFS